MRWEDYDAALFDLDGVLTPTAEVHQHAWRDTFSQFLTEHAPDAAPYQDSDYFDHVDGKPRYEGVASFLTSRGIELPHGDPTDDPGAETVCGVGNSKNEAFTQILERDGVTPYPGSVRLLDALQARGTAMAVVSSSKNAGAVLRAAGLADRFTVVVDGAVAADQGLPGKPRHDTYTYAARQLGVATTRSVVVEDAISGVQAGADGDFGLVVGVDRGAGREELIAQGADIVVDDLAELVGDDR